MQKIPEHFAAVIRRVIFIGFSVQIVLGILWMCNAFAGFDSPGKGIVCVGQTVLLSASFCFLLQSVGPKRAGMRCFLILSVLTFPMVMQCLVMADVRVLTAALLLTEVGCVLRLLYSPQQGKSWVFSALAAGCWLAAGLIRSEFFWFGMIPMLFYMLLGEKERHAQKILHVQRKVLLTLATAGLIVGIGSFYRSPADFTAIAADRVAWTTLYLDYESLPNEQRERVNYWDMVESTYEATGVEEILLPSLVESFGEKEARVVLKELVSVAWKDYRGRIVKEIIWDLAGYTVPALVVPMQLQGKAYESYTGINYRQLLRAAPRLGKYYLHYSCWWFLTALALRAVVWLLEERHIERKKFSLIGTTVIFCVLCYAMSGAGKMDYKNTLFVNCVWLIWLASAAFGSAAKDMEESE